MNMPVDDLGCVHFNTTLFALIRESLSIKMGPASVMDIKDAELRDTVREMWPLQAKKMLNLLIPSDRGQWDISSVLRNRWALNSNAFVYLSAELTCGKMTTGKIYAGLRIYENWLASGKLNKNECLVS